MTGIIKNRISLKKSLSRSTNFIGLQNLAIDISELISIRKEEYYNNFSKKLHEPNTRTKTYWLILESFYKGTRVPLVPPLLVNNRIVSDFTEKANLLNDFFSLFLSLSVHQSVIALYYPQENFLKLIKNYLHLILRKMIFLK